MNGKSIILVDDVGSISNKIRSILSTISQDVFTAENCYELMNMIYKQKPKLLIFNNQINWLNTTEFVFELRHNSKISSNIIFIYESVEANFLSEASAMNIICMKHPFKMAEFLISVKSQLED